MPADDYPCFNPNNAEELCFSKAVKINNGLHVTEFWKVNINTGKQERIAAVQGISQPDWGKNDWILFDKLGGTIWKVKSNGDSLTQLTFQYENYRPKWNNQTNTFLNHIPSEDPYKSLVIRNLKGNIINYLKTFDGNGVSNKNAFSLDGQTIASDGMLSRKNYGLYYYELANSTSPQLLYSLDISQTTKALVIGVAWHPDNRHVFWTNANGLYKTDIVSKQTWQLKTACDSRLYKSLSVSPDGKTIAVARSDKKLVEENTINSEFSIYLMDDNRNNERKLEL